MIITNDSYSEHFQTEGDKIFYTNNYKDNWNGCIKRWGMHGYDGWNAARETGLLLEAQKHWRLNLRFLFMFRVVSFRFISFLFFFFFFFFFFFISSFDWRSVPFVVLVNIFLLSSCISNYNCLRFVHDFFFAIQIQCSWSLLWPTVWLTISGQNKRERLWRMMLKFPAKVGRW